MPVPGAGAGCQCRMPDAGALTTHLHLDPPEAHQVAAPETSGTSPGTCTKTLYIEPNQVSAP